MTYQLLLNTLRKRKLANTAEENMQHAVNKNRLHKSDENFFHRTKLLHNIVIKHYEEYGNQLDKKSISKFIGITLSENSII